MEYLDLNLSPKDIFADVDIAEALSSLIISEITWLFPD